MKKCVLKFFIKDSLFAMNQYPIFSSSSLTFVKSWLILLWEYKRFALLTNIGSKILEALLRSLT